MILEHQNYLECRCLLCQQLEQKHVAARFGAVLKRARLKSKFPTPESLAIAVYQRCGIHHSARSIYRYEKGTHSPSLDFLVALSFVLGPELFSDLLTETLSPGVIGKFEVSQVATLYDSSKQLKLFEL